MTTKSKYQNGASYENRARRLRKKLQKKYIVVHAAWVLGVPVEFWHSDESKWGNVEPYKSGDYSSLLAVLFDDNNEAGYSSKAQYIQMCRIARYAQPFLQVRYRIKQ